MNTYLFLTGRENELYNDKGISSLLPPRFLKGSSVPLVMLTSGITESKRAKEGQAFFVKQLAKKYEDKLNWEEDEHGNSIMYYTDKKGNVIFKLPSEIDPAKYPKEHAFFQKVYEHFYKYDPDYKNVARTGTSYPKRIIERRIFATEAELRKIKGIGAKWAGRFHDMLSTTSYDDYRIPIQTFKKLTRTWVDDEKPDKTGKLVPVIKSIKIFIINPSGLPCSV